MGTLGTLDQRERECRHAGGCHLWERQPGPTPPLAACMERAVGGQALGAKGRVLPSGHPSEVTPFRL